MVKTSRVVSKVVLLAPDGETLLLRRSSTDVRRPLQWDLAGGMVDDGEDFVSAAVRETKEEAGIDINRELLNLSYTMSANTEKGNVCWLFFVCQLSDKPKISLSSEHDEFVWLPFKDAIKQINYERQNQALMHIQQYVLG